MKLIESFRSYLLEEEFKINIFDNKINIVNYTDITGFCSNEVIVKHKSGEVIIKGNDLIITKLLIDELLIVGNIKNIELR